MKRKTISLAMLAWLSIFSIIAVMFSLNLSPQKSWSLLNPIWQSLQAKSTLDRIHERGYLRVGLITVPPVYFPERPSIRGREYNMLLDYSKTLGLELQVTAVNKFNQLLPLIKNKQVDLILMGSMPKPKRADITFHKIPHQESWYVVGSKDSDLPTTLDEIHSHQLIIADGSRQLMVLRNSKHLQSLTWQTRPVKHVSLILQEVNENEQVLTIINSSSFKYYQHLYPELHIAFQLPQDYSEYLATLRHSDDSLSVSLELFLRDYAKTFKTIDHDYIDHLRENDYVDSYRYLRRIKQRLTQYYPSFIAAGKLYSYDPRLLAAISYQESHWNPEAKSPTGVRGLMMLTENTARDLGIADRSDPNDSILGGTQYLYMLNKSLPHRIQYPDRIWLALAAYNIGSRYLEDARVLAQSAGDDPDLWLDVKQQLSKLGDEQWYNKHDRERGHQAVFFVQQIRRYYDILCLYQWNQANLKIVPRESKKIDYLPTI